MRIGGAVLINWKNECGARLSTPSTLVVDTHAIGRGDTRALSRE